MKRLAKRLDLVLVFLLFLSTIPAEYNESFSFLETQTITMRHALRATLRGPEGFDRDKLVLVTVDETFYGAYGKFPLTRGDLARIIENIDSLGASVICVDFFLGLPSAYGQDGDLAKALMQSRAVLASEGIFDSNGRFLELQYPAPIFRQTAQSGYVNLISPSSDRTFLSRLRVYPEMTALEDGWPISVKVLSRYLGEKPRLENRKLVMGDFSIPLDHFNDICIDFSAIPDGYNFLHEAVGISAYEFLDIDGLGPLELTELKEWVDGKVVFIGETLPASNDWFDTPVGLIYGVEIIADTVNTLLNRAPLRPAPFWLEILLGALIFGSLVLVTSLLRGPGVQLLAALGIFALYTLVSVLAYAYLGSVFSMTQNLVLGLAAFFILSIYSYMRDRAVHIAGRNQAEAELRRAHDELEVRVLQRTEELSEANQLLKGEINERKRIEGELKQAKKAADKANQAKSDFVSNMSHEIRTPLNAVIGFSEIALNRDMPPKLKDYFTKINTSSHYLLGIINDVLDFAKIEAGRLELEITDFHLRAVVEGVADLLGGMAAHKGLRLGMDIAPETPLALKGDPLRLGQILTNLLSNAIKFTSRGSVSLSIRPERQDSGSAFLRFAVTDTGIGIDSRQAESLFESFTQADTSTSRRFGGSGLGLTISKSLVALMGGEIAARGEPGKGSTFSFTALFKKSSAGPEQALSQTGQRQAEESARKIAGARVLLVEDNPFNREVASEMLAQAGIRVEHAENGREALDKIRPGRYDAVIMDVQMPVMDGYEATRRLRARPELADLVIIAMTAHAMKEEKVRCLEAGMNDYLTKPIILSRLYATLAAWVSPAAAPAPGREPRGQEIGLPEALPGLDIRAGIDGVGGSEEFFLRILGRFAESYKDSIAELSRAILEKDGGTLKLASHTLKGAAGQIGAEELRLCAMRFEEAVVAGDTAGLLPLLKEMGERIEKVFASIRELKLRYGPESAPAPPGEALDSEAVEILVSELRGLLENGEFAAVERVKALREKVFSKENEEIVSLLEGQVDQYEFDSALELLDQLAQALFPGKKEPVRE